MKPGSPAKQGGATSRAVTEVCGNAVQLSARSRCLPGSCAPHSRLGFSPWEASQLESEVLRTPSICSPRHVDFGLVGSALPHQPSASRPEVHRFWRSGCGLAEHMTLTGLKRKPRFRTCLPSLGPCTNKRQSPGCLCPCAAQRGCQRGGPTPQELCSLPGPSLGRRPQGLQPLPCVERPKASLLALRWPTYTVKVMFDLGNIRMHIHASFLD